MDKNLKGLILKSVALAMGVATLILNIINTISIKNSIILLSIGLVCLPLNELEKNSKFKVLNSRLKKLNN